MSALHCPNPKCTHTFAAAQMPATGAVRCPKCGQEFRFRAPPKAPAPPTRPKGVFPVGKPPTSSMPTRLDPPAKKPGEYPWTMPAMPQPAGNVPQSAQSMPARPVAPAPGHVPRKPAASVEPKTEKIVHVRGLKNNRARHKLLKFAVVTLVTVIFLAGLAFGIINFEKFIAVAEPNRDPGTSGTGLIFHVRNQRGADEKGFTLNIDKEIWSADKDMRNRLKCLAVFKRADEHADSWLGVAVQDFGFRKPREGELINGAIDRLRSLYGDTLQINAAKLEPAKIGGLDAQRCTFTGRLNVVWWGEVYLVAHHGFAYWVFVAAPTLEAAQQQFAEIESQSILTFTTDRRGWVEQPPQNETFASRSNAFIVQVPEKVWRKNDPLTSDENGEIYLSGFFQSLQGLAEGASLRKNATLLGVSLERKVDSKEAYKAAMDYLQAKKKEESKDYVFVPIKEGASLIGEEKTVGDQPGFVGEMRLMRGAENTQYVKLAVFSDQNKTYAFRFECAPENEAIWRKEFDDLIKTVRLTKE